MSEDDEQNDDQKKALLTLAIELGDKKKQLLNIYLDSKPEQLAYDFCLQNNLDFDSMENLKEEIKNALANYNADAANQNEKKENQEEVEQKNEENEERENEENILSKENENENENEELSKENEQEEQEIQNINENENDIKKEKKDEDEIKVEKKEIEEDKEKEEKEINDIKEPQKEDKQIKEENKEIPQEIPQEKEQENKKELPDLDNKENKEEKEEKEENQIKNELDNNNKEEAAEEALLKEEERDKVIEQNNEVENPEEKDNNENNEENENTEEEEDIQSYLSPTICFQNKQREKFKSNQKQDFPEFDTHFEKYDKISQFRQEINEKPVNHLTINTSNQKYLPKDYFDNPENKNFGALLYDREKIMKETAMEKAKLKAKKENKLIEENMTFSPKINDYNLIALQNRQLNEIKYNEEKRILNYKDYLKKKEKNLKNKHYADIEKENTFAPKIDKNSEKLAGNRSLQIPRYEQLYKKKKDIKKLEEKIYDNKAMFKPKINKNYKGIKTDNNNKMNEYAKLTFEERQKRFKERLEENNKKLFEINKSNVEKKYFKPTINKNKKLDIERKNKKIFNELYRDSTKYQVKREELIKKINELERGLY